MCGDEPPCHAGIIRRGNRRSRLRPARRNRSLELDQRTSPEAQAKTCAQDDEAVNTTRTRTKAIRHAVPQHMLRQGSSRKSDRHCGGSRRYGTSQCLGNGHNKDRKRDTWQRICDAGAATPGCDNHPRYETLPCVSPSNVPLSRTVGCSCCENSAAHRRWRVARGRLLSTCRARPGRSPPEPQARSYTSRRDYSGEDLAGFEQRLEISSTEGHPCETRRAFSWLGRVSHG